MEVDKDTKTNTEQAEEEELPKDPYHMDILIQVKSA
jgi:hypothetical protein